MVSVPTSARMKPSRSTFTNLQSADIAVSRNRLTNKPTDMKFTDQEKELLQEMLDFPSSYKLTPKGVEVVKGLLKKIQEID